MPTKTAALRTLIRRRLSGTLIGIHATLAISGFVVLIVYVTA
ncbi:hypothetical protein [Nitrobacter sp.]